MPSANLSYLAAACQPRFRVFSPSSSSRFYTLYRSGVEGSRRSGIVYSLVVFFAVAVHLLSHLYGLRTISCHTEFTRSTYSRVDLGRTPLLSGCYRARQLASRWHRAPPCCFFLSSLDHAVESMLWSSKLASPSIYCSVGTHDRPSGSRYGQAVWKCQL